MIRAVFASLMLGGILCAQSQAACGPRMRHYWEAAKHADDGQWKEWNNGGDERERVCLALGDLFDAVDRRGRFAVDKADRAVNLAVQLGVAGKTTIPVAGSMSVAESMFSKDAAYVVTMLPEPPSASAMAQVNKAVEEYRQAIIDFAEELSRRCSSRKLMDARGVGPDVKSDFCSSALRRRFVPNQGYDAALFYLTDPNIETLNDNKSRTGAALSRFDYRLRNLLAVRAAALRALVGGAKITEDDLSPETLKQVQGSSEYHRLEQIVKNAVDQ